MTDSWLVLHARTPDGREHTHAGVRVSGLCAQYQSWTIFQLARLSTVPLWLILNGRMSHHVGREALEEKPAVYIAHICGRNFSLNTHALAWIAMCISLHSPVSRRRGRSEVEYSTFFERPFTAVEWGEKKTRQMAKVRIHVERVISQVKTVRLVKNTFSSRMAHRLNAVCTLTLSG